MSKSVSSDKICIGQSIRDYRSRNGISLKQFAATLGVSPQAVNKWEHGTTYPDITIIPDIAKLLGVSVSRLFGEESPASPEQERWSIYIVKHG